MVRGEGGSGKLAAGAPDWGQAITTASGQQIARRAGGIDPIRLVRPDAAAGVGGTRTQEGIAATRAAVAGSAHRSGPAELPTIR